MVAGWTGRPRMSDGRWTSRSGCVAVTAPCTSTSGRTTIPKSSGTRWSPSATTSEVPRLPGHRRDSWSTTARVPGLDGLAPGHRAARRRRHSWPGRRRSALFEGSPLYTLGYLPTFSRLPRQPRPSRRRLGGARLPGGDPRCRPIARLSPVAGFPLGLPAGRRHDPSNCSRRPSSPVDAWESHRSLMESQYPGWTFLAGRIALAHGSDHQVQQHHAAEADHRDHGLHHRPRLDGLPDGEPEVLLDQPEAGVVDVAEEQRARSRSRAPAGPGVGRRASARAGRGCPAAVIVRPWPTRSPAGSRPRPASRGAGPRCGSSWRGWR